MRGRRTRVSSAVAVLILLLGTSNPARADDTTKAESLIREGIELRRAGRDGPALPLFQKAYEIARTPRSAAQLGLCNLALGYWLDAETFLAESLSSPSHPWISQNHETLQASLDQARRNIGELQLVGTPAGAQVLIDRREVGRLPLVGPLHLNAGPHDFELVATGHVSARKTLTVGGGTRETLKLDLARATLPDPPVVKSIAPAAPPLDTSAGPANFPARRPFAWVAGGGAAIALAFAIVETTTWIDKERAFDNHQGVIPSSGRFGNDCGADDPVYGGVGCADLHGELSRARALALVGYGVGVALGVTSGLLFATSSERPPNTELSLSCAPALAGSRGVSCALSF
jgi:PEGA domain